MLTSYEHHQLKQLITQAATHLAASGNTRNSYARRRRQRHLLYKTIGEMNKIVREHDRTPITMSPAPMRTAAPQRASHSAGF